MLGVNQIDTFYVDIRMNVTTQGHVPICIFAYSGIASRLFKFVLINYYVKNTSSVT